MYYNLTFALKRELCAYYHIRGFAQWNNINGYIIIKTSVFQRINNDSCNKVKNMKNVTESELHNYFSLVFDGVFQIKRNHMQTYLF